MNAPYESKVRDSIEAAFSSAEAGRSEEAVQLFALARTQALRLAEPGALKNAIAKDKAAYVREREAYRALFPSKPDAKRKLLIIADSLGLPRPEDKIGDRNGAGRTYSGLIHDKYDDLSVTSICQRFLTMPEVAKLLVDDPDLGRGSDILLHLGLNDCANRMYLEPERLSLSLLGKETRERMVEFTRIYRRDIILLLPSHHYTTLPHFRAQLDMIFGLLRSRDAGKVIVTSIILPPARSWPGTPDMNRNFAAYNVEIMNAAHRHGGHLFDFDRHIWQAQHTGVLLPDGMHLSDVGHQLFTAKCDPYLR